MSKTLKYLHGRKDYIMNMIYMHFCSSLKFMLPKYKLIYHLNETILRTQGNKNNRTLDDIHFKQQTQKMPDIFIQKSITQNLLFASL